MRRSPVGGPGLQVVRYLKTHIESQRVKVGGKGTDDTYEE